MTTPEVNIFDSVETTPTINNFEKILQRNLPPVEELDVEESDTNPFALLELDPVEKRIAFQNSSKDNPFEALDAEQSWGEWVVRSASQVASGAARALTWPLDIIQAMGVGDALDPEEIDRLIMHGERIGVPFDEEAYRRAVMEAANMFPTQGNIERGLESTVGIPFEPKDKFQKGLRLGTEIASLRPGSAAQKVVGGALGAATSRGLQDAGLPEPVANIVGFGAGSVVTPKLPTAKAATKESGLTTRRFEDVTKPTKVSPRRAEILDRKIESEVRGIADELIKTGKSAKTFEALKEGENFKGKIGELFEEVNVLAKEIPGDFSTKDLKISLKRMGEKGPSKGITTSESEKVYSKFMNQFAKDTKIKDVSASQLVEQYRKNNEVLSKLYEPGKSKAFNNAKKEAYLDYNREIADMIQAKYPDTEFSKLFDFTNKRWSEIKNIEFAEKFLDDMFKSKKPFDKASKFFTKQTSEPFKKLLGEENFSQFKGLMDDFVSLERSRGLISTSKKSGIGDFGFSVKFLIHPKFTSLKYGFDQTKNVYKSLLDKPKLIVEWRKGIDATKRGDFDSAKKIFKFLDQELDFDEEDED